jgi:hypothetical protein
MNSDMNRHYGLKEYAVVKLILQDSGTYNTVYSRPYDTNITMFNLNQITERLVQNGTGFVTPNLFSGIASNFVAPSATPMGEIPIYNGWGENRLRFVLELYTELNTGSIVIHYIQGFTNYNGVSSTGNIDPAMIFTINSIIVVNRQLVPGPGGTLISRDFVSSCNHLLSDIESDAGYNCTHKYSMRPEDIYTGIHSGLIQTSYTNTGSLIDSRRYLQNIPKASNRSNSLSSNYLNKAINGYQDALSLAAFGQSNENIIERAISQCVDMNISENIFMMLLQNNGQSQHRISRNFTTTDLRSIDPNLDSKAHYLSLGATVRAQLPTAGTTEFWNGTDRLTQVANIISQGVPALMMDLLIGSIGLRSTNMTAGSQPDTIINNVRTFASESMIPNIELFKARFEKELMYDVTFGNQETYLIDIVSNIYGDTRIELSLNGGPMTPFNTATYCDSLSVPLITNDPNQYQKIINDFDSLSNTIGEVVGDKYMSSYLINKGI